jgi:hypothetical protein
MRSVGLGFAGCHAFMKTEELDMDNVMNRGWYFGAGLSLVRFRRTEQAWKKWNREVTGAIGN